MSEFSLRTSRLENFWTFDASRETQKLQEERGCGTGRAGRAAAQGVRDRRPRELGLERNDGGRSEGTVVLILRCQGTVGLVKKTSGYGRIDFTMSGYGRIDFTASWYGRMILGPQGTVGLIFKAVKYGSFDLCAIST